MSVMQLLLIQLLVINGVFSWLKFRWGSRGEKKKEVCKEVSSGSALTEEEEKGFLYKKKHSSSNYFFPRVFVDL
jgi:hypothetical protein